MDRRGFVLMGAATVAALGTVRWVPSAHAEPTTVAPGLAIVPRSDWGGDLPVLTPMEPEAPGDVRFLLIHHTASSNDYSQDATVGLLRSFYDLHTTEKGWPDVAYNFFVDRYGTVFEGRTGSLHEPVKADATGGSQGFALLCCLVGDFTAELPTLEAHTSMTKLLAWLADTYGIDTTPGATTTFVSRGSNLHPSGSEVTTPTISGHRDMSQTACPGDALYPTVRADYQQNVTVRRTEVAAAATTTTPTSTTAVADVTTSSPAGPGPTSMVDDRAVGQPPDDGGSSASRTPLYVGGGGIALASIGGALILRSRTRTSIERDASAHD